MSVAVFRTVELPTVRDQRGNLTIVESDVDIPFEIRRVYYLYDVPGGAQRAGHAHRKLQQVMVAVAGSFDVLIDDGRERSVITLNRAYRGLYLPQLVWRELVNFSSGAVCLVLCSEPYEETDYLRDYDEFARIVDDVAG